MVIGLLWGVFETSIREEFAALDGINRHFCLAFRTKVELEIIAVKSRQVIL